MTKTYAQLTREIQALQAQADKLHQSEKKDVIARLNESIAQFGLSAQDLRFPGTSAASSSSVASSASTRSRASSRSAASANEVKYSDGPGRVWGGRGPRPAWLREAIAQGRSLESFAVGAGKSARRAAGASAPAKVSLPPRYGHPKTGQTWSGRGPKPTWLKQGLKKRGASIDDFLLSATASPQAQAPSDASRKPAPVQKATAPRAGAANARTTKAPTAGTGDKAPSPKPMAEQSGGSAQATPAAASKTRVAAPAKKSVAAPSPAKPRKAPGQVASNTPAGATATPRDGEKPTPASPAGSVKKPGSAKRPAAAAPTPTVKRAQAPAKKAAPARKNLPASMAPTTEPAPASANVNGQTPPAPAPTIPSGEAGDRATTAGH